MQNIGKNLKEIREQYNIRMKEIERNTGISTANISRWKNNKVIPSIEHCIILADFYGITIDELIGHEVKKNW